MLNYLQNNNNYYYYNKMVTQVPSPVLCTTPTSQSELTPYDSVKDESMKKVR
jgi:hypothetical protein